MKIRNFVCIAACLSLLALVASPSYGQLYSQDFDVDDTANWTIATGNPTDQFADFTLRVLGDEGFTEVETTGGTVTVPK